MIIGFTCGAYDLFHAGHVLALKESRKQCDKLIVGLHTNPALDRPEKNKPIQSLEERIVQLEGCKYVDDIIIYDRESDLVKILTENKQGINVRFLGADWEHKDFTGKGIIQNEIFTPRDHTYSSSSLRKRIKDAEIESENIIRLKECFLMEQSDSEYVPLIDKALCS